MIKNLLTFLLAVSAFAQTATITDTIYTPFGGTFGGTVTVSLNSPGLAQPLYSGNVTLSGWTQTVTVTAGAFSLTLYTNDLITPGGTSYTATFAPNAGSSWKETWIVPTGATTIREIRSTTVPSPSVRFTPSQITQAGATLNQVLRWNGSTWAPATAAGGGSGTVTSVSVTTANGVSGTVANPTTTPAITLSLGAITPSSVAASGTVSGSNLSGTNTGDQTNITGNAGTATALAADPANCSAGTLPRGVDASGVGQGCAAVSLTSEVTGTLPNANTTATSSNTASAIVARDASGNFTAGTVTAALTGNASTATALAANPTDCAAGQFATTIAASGNLTCAAVALADVSGAVGGASSLTTVGSVPFVTSAGVLGQNTNFRFFNATGNLAVGTSTDGNFRFDVGSSGTSGTARFYDQTPTTGTTFLVVRAGAGQSGNLQEWQAANGTAVSGISTSGLSLGTTASPALLVISSSSGQMLYADNNSVSLNSPGILGWTATVNSTSSKDLSLSRASANVLQVGDGAANANGTILARIHTWGNGTEGTCDATLRGQVVMVQGGTGVADTFRVCRKDAANAYAWTALY